MGRPGLELCNMEKAKLLRLLILIYCILIANTAFAEVSDVEWAKGAALSDHTRVREDFKHLMQDKDFDQDLRDSVLKPRPVLQIFVSSSMSKQLLKNYAKEAYRYEGVLVFRGLPSNSFRKLTNLVMDISDEKFPTPMQIDDEAFTRFGISTVPSIVLTMPNAMFSEQTSHEKFDKVAGNITIKAALEIFAQQGDLSLNAREILK